MVNSNHFVSRILIIYGSSAVQAFNVEASKWPEIFVMLRKPTPDHQELRAMKSMDIFKKCLWGSACFVTDLQSIQKPGKPLLERLPQVFKASSKMTITAKK